MRNWQMIWTTINRLQIAKWQRQRTTMAGLSLTWMMKRINSKSNSINWGSSVLPLNHPSQPSKRAWEMLKNRSIRKINRLRSLKRIQQIRMRTSINRHKRTWNTNSLFTSSKTISRTLLRRWVHWRIRLSLWKRSSTLRIKITLSLPRSSLKPIISVKFWTRDFKLLRTNRPSSSKSSWTLVITRAKKLKFSRIRLSKSNPNTMNLRKKSRWLYLRWRRAKRILLLIRSRKQAI